MFDPKWVRENWNLLDLGLKRRGMSDNERQLVFQRFVELDETRRKVIGVLQVHQERRNILSKDVGSAKAAKDEARAATIISEVAGIKNEIPKYEENLRTIEAELTAELAKLPNIPADDVPDGKDASANKERHKHGTPKQYKFKPKQHSDLGKALELMDFETAAKLSGARFVVLKGALARLERALAQFMLDIHTSEHGYTEVNPPLLVRPEAMFGTAQLPKFADDQFLATTLLAQDKFWSDYDAARDAQFEDMRQQKISPAVMARESLKRQREWVEKAYSHPDYARSLWLIPTAEVPLTNLVRESILEETDLPKRFTACTPCFRAEAGAAGKDTHGMIRQHQFTKVELVSITTPEQSAEEHERMLNCAEAVLKKLDLPLRTVTLCTGDMGFAAQKTYDIEVWLPGEGAYREISSCSNCGEFQARRMQARYRPTKAAKFDEARFDKSVFAGVRPVHTLNGSGVAVGRALIAVLENYQDEGGAIAIPDALKPYMGGIARIEKPA